MESVLLQAVFTAVTWVGEVDAALRINPQIVGAVELLAAEAIGQHGHFAFRRDPSNAAVSTFACQQIAVQVAFMMVFVGASGQRRERYFAWLDKKVIAPLQKEHPEIWDAALKYLRSYIPRLMEIDDGEDAQ